MAKQVIFLVCALLVITNGEVLSSRRALIDEVREEVKELESTVQGEILAAHGDFNNMQTEFATNANNLEQTGTLAIVQEQESINTEITSIKELAASVNADITTCIILREQLLSNLLTTYTKNIDICISSINNQVVQMVRDATYLVDVVINKVHDLENQVGRCGGQINCLSLLATEIELDKIRLPNNIQTEVQATEHLLTIKGLSVQSCSDNSVSGYTSQANVLLEEIKVCVDRILE